MRIRRDFPLGRYPLKIEHTELRLSDYQDFLAAEADSIDAFRRQQRGAFDAERQRWIESGQAHFESEEVAADLGETPRSAPASTASRATSPATSGGCRWPRARGSRPATCW